MHTPTLCLRAAIGCSLFLHFTLVSAQTFRMGYLGIGATDFLECANGDYVLASGTSLLHGPVRLDNNGSVLWTAHVNAYSILFGVVETTDGDLITGTSYVDSTGRLRPAIVKLDANGNLLWSRFFVCDTVDVRAHRLIRIAADRNIMLTLDQGTNAHMNTLICFNDAGVVQWALKSTPNIPDITFDELVVGSGGSFYIMTNEDFNGAIMKLGFAGSVLWSNEYALGAQYIGRFYDGITDTDGNPVFLARPLFNAAYGDFLTMKCDATGAPTTAVGYTINAAGQVYGGDMDVDANGQRVINMAYGSSDLLVMLTDASGTPVWSKKNENDVFMYGGDIDVLNDGRFVNLTTASTPGASLLLHRSDAALEIDGCFEPFGLTTVVPPTIQYGALAYPMNNSAVATVSFTTGTSSIAAPMVLPCSPSEVEVSVAPTAFAVTMDPLSGLLHVNGTTGPGEVHIVNGAGQVVHSGQHTGTSFDVDVHGLANGLYTITVFDASGTRVQRFIR
ncbi:MAG: T9SS type A sorting domain-containing protein [Flavobacteriales bacterium]